MRHLSNKLNQLNFMPEITSLEFGIKKMKNKKGMPITKPIRNASFGG